MGWGSTGRVVTAVFRLECRFRLVDTIVALLEVLLHEWKFSCGLIMLGHPPLPWCVVPLEFSDVDTCTSTCETLWAWGNCALQVLTNMAEFSASVLDRWLVLEIRRVLFIILLSDFYCLLLFGKLLAICQQQQRPQPLRPTPCFSSISAPFSEVDVSQKGLPSTLVLAYEMLSQSWRIQLWTSALETFFDGLRQNFRKYRKTNTYNILNFISALF